MRDENLETVLSNAHQGRMTELTLSKPSPTQWACFAFALQSMDGFYCEPLAVVTVPKQHFARRAPGQVDGLHSVRTSISRDQWSALHNAFACACGQLPQGSEGCSGGQRDLMPGLRGVLSM
ncbi:hypothetical protein BBP40_004936 [Aspergillus hancockii]|nr:hypothetical protein BBP40_004936 [Aspergillus hancockii]